MPMRGRKVRGRWFPDRAQARVLMHLTASPQAGASDKTQPQGDEPHEVGTPSRMGVNIAQPRFGMQRQVRGRGRGGYN